jgi:hypothetical protein
MPQQALLIPPLLYLGKSRPMGVVVRKMATLSAATGQREVVVQHTVTVEILLITAALDARVDLALVLLQEVQRVA